MFAAVLKELTGALDDKRFLLHALFPAIAFAAALAATIVLGGGNASAVAARWNEFDGITQVLVVIVVITALYVFASLIASRWLTIVQAFEGYIGPIKLMASSGKGWHRRKLRYLLTTHQYSDAYLRYPLQDDDVMPTALGNAIRSGERYPFDRYSLESIVVWPRLYHLLPADFVGSIAAARSAMEGMLVLSVLAGAYALAGPTYLAFATAVSSFAVVAVYAAALLVAVITYRAAVSHALVFSEHLKTAFDLHRHLVFEKMRLPVPANSDEDARRWRDLERFLYRNAKVPFNYAEPKR